ncbi:hypothetical protein ACFLVC_05225, partial [Chloroflexota bacterium]
MSKLNWYNKFSEKERDRRWQLMREFMQNKGMDALLVLGVGLSPTDTGRTAQMQSLDRYLSGWANRCSVVFPLKGEPVLLGAMFSTVLRWTPETPKEEFPWIGDVRVSDQGEAIVEALREKGLERGHVGVGFSGTSATGRRLNAAATTVRDQAAKELPDCNFEDVTDDLLQLMIVKSEEELTLFRRGAEAMEKAMTAVAKVVRVGASDLDVYLALMNTLWENGAIPSEPRFTSGPATTSTGDKLWNFGLSSPRVLEAGDVVNLGN